MTERARAWQRVSTEGQDEASQLPDLVKWCDSHGYEYDVSEAYVVRGKSAYHGKHQAALDRAFADMAEGQYTVLVVWAADRIERRGALAALTLAERAREAGGRIEYVKDSHLNATNDMSDVMLALSATLARQESQRKAERIVAKHDALRSAGSVVGRAPWGYEIVARDGVKVLVPTDAGRAWVPLVFQAVIDGKSLRAVAETLDAAGVPTPTNGIRWHEAFIGNRLIRNPTYYGNRPNAGALETEGLVSATTWQQANEALSGRVRPGRGTVKREKALLAPVCGNPECDATGPHPSPMYRINARGFWYYRCTGRGPQRHGCGLMLPMEQVESDVVDAMLSNQMWHTERVFVPGDDRSDEIARLRERGAAAMRAGDYATATDAMNEAATLEGMPRVAPHWRDKVTEQSEADYFASLDRDGQREYLSTRIITASRDGVVIVPRWAVAG